MMPDWMAGRDHDPTRLAQRFASAEPGGRTRRRSGRTGVARTRRHELHVEGRRRAYRAAAIDAPGTARYRIGRGPTAAARVRGVLDGTIRAGTLQINRCLSLGYDRLDVRASLVGFNEDSVRVVGHTVPRMAWRLTAARTSDLWNRCALIDSVRDPRRRNVRSELVGGVPSCRPREPSAPAFARRQGISGVLGA